MYFTTPYECAKITKDYLLFREIWNDSALNQKGRGYFMDNFLYIYPDFLMDFRCIGSECMNTCCEGWDI